MESEQSLTQLLIRWGDGDQAALDELMPMVYDDLRRYAHSFLRSRGRDQTLQPTALVNEAYLRLLGKQNSSWQNRAQFFALAAKVMRDLLVDYARAQAAAKRGGSQQWRLSLSKADRLSSKSEVDLLALDQALTELTALNPQYGRIVELRYFGGLTTAETATVLGLSVPTIERGWRFAKAWLRTQLS